MPVIKRVANETRWRPSPVDEGVHSSQEKWKKPTPRAKWKEVSCTAEELAMLEKDKKGTWVTSCTQSFKGESEVFFTQMNWLLWEQPMNTPGDAQCGH